MWNILTNFKIMILFKNLIMQCDANNHAMLMMFADQTKLNISRAQSREKIWSASLKFFGR
jgi:frataxin-like iron-binding protein CyaY